MALDLLEVTFLKAICHNNFLHIETMVASMVKSIILDLDTMEEMIAAEVMCFSGSNQF